MGKSNNQSSEVADKKKKNKRKRVTEGESSNKSSSEGASPKDPMDCWKKRSIFFKLEYWERIIVVELEAWVQPLLQQTIMVEDFRICQEDVNKGVAPVM